MLTCIICAIVCAGPSQNLNLFLFLSVCPQTPLFFPPLAFAVDPLSAQAFAQWAHFKQTKHKLYINKQITSFIFPVGLPNLQGASSVKLSALTPPLPVLTTVPIYNSDFLPSSL